MEVVSGGDEFRDPDLKRERERDGTLKGCSGF